MSGYVLPDCYPFNLASVRDKYSSVDTYSEHNKMSPKAWSNSAQSAKRSSTQDKIQTLECSTRTLSKDPEYQLSIDNHVAVVDLIKSSEI